MLDDDDELESPFSVDADDNVLRNGERLYVPFMMADSSTASFRFKDAATLSELQRAVVHDKAARQAACDAAARSVAGRVHAVPIVDRQMFADAEAARAQWIKDQKTAWMRGPTSAQDARHVHTITQHDPMGREASRFEYNYQRELDDDDEGRRSRDSRSTTTDARVDAYQQYCVASNMSAHVRARMRVNCK